MSQFYKITSVKPTGWDPDQYGNVVDSVFVEGEKDSLLWRHAPTTEATVGLEVYGHIETAKSGKGQWLKKEQVPDDVQQPSSNAPTGSPSTPTARSNAGDGARQGMAINNAATYVAAKAKDSLLTPEEFAAEVTEYAKEIYKIDLTASAKADEVMDFMAS